MRFVIVLACAPATTFITNELKATRKATGQL